MIEEKLEILIITYNRAQYLARTLQQFAKSPFAGCKFTILDNCSTDETPQVCAEQGRRFAQFHVVGHRVNIGLSANYLRAVELSSSTYSWVLCDDDLFDFTDCADVIAALEEEKVDLISVGSPGQEHWERGVWTTGRAAAQRGANYFGVLTFASGLIFRTALFDSDAVVKGYRAAATAYPHFPFVTKTVEDDRVLYVSRTRVSIWDPRQNFDSDLHFWKLYVGACQTIPDRALRQQVIDEMFPTRAQWLHALARGIFRDKMHRRKGLAGQLFNIGLGFGARQRLLLALLSPLLLVPGSVYRGIQQQRKGKAVAAAEATVVDSFRLS